MPHLFEYSWELHVKLIFFLRSRRNTESYHQVLLVLMDTSMRTPLILRYQRTIIVIPGVVQPQNNTIIM